MQESLRRKKDAFKKWQRQGGNELKEAYKEWYDKTETSEGERMIYKVAKQIQYQWAISIRDIGEVNIIKGQIGEMLTDEVKIKERWREYFSNLLNVENAREQLGGVPVVEGSVQEISREEVKKAI